MTATALFLTAALAAATPGTTSTPALSAPTASDPQRPQGEGQPTTTTERPHQIGVGGQLTMGSAGIAGGMRTFFGEHVGINLSAGWYRNASGNRTASNQGSTFAVMPSVIVMLSKPNLSRQMDIRPYVGGGVNYVNASTPRTSTGVPYTGSTSGVGGQVFGGAEMTFRDARAVTISVEGIYYALPVNYINTNVIDGFNWVLAFHFYLR